MSDARTERPARADVTATEETTSADGAVRHEGQADRDEGQADRDEGQAVRDEGLWRGDSGTLRIESRRALLRLVQGPYLSASQSPVPWAALLADERTLRSRLHDLFLDLVIDVDRGFALVRNVDAGEVDVPRAVRSETLTFLDTAMLLVLRQLLLAREGEGRVIVGQEEVFEQLAPFRTADRDETDFARRLNASWQKMLNKLRIVHTASEGRVEISPVLRLLVDADQARAIGAEYERIREAGAGEETPDDDA